MAADHEKWEYCRLEDLLGRGFVGGKALSTPLAVHQVVDPVNPPRELRQTKAALTHLGLMAISLFTLRAFNQQSHDRPPFLFDVPRPPGPEVAGAGCAA